MDKGILLATKTLVESICHYSRDPNGVFFACHAREWHIDKKWHIDVVVKMAVEFQVCGVERSAWHAPGLELSDSSLLRATRKC